MKSIESFNFEPGRIIGKKYKIVRFLGAGWEGEVYLLHEINTQIERAGKFFFPHRNPKNKCMIRYAKKLHKLRHCPIVMQYSSQDSIMVKAQEIHFLVSEFINGRLLKDYLNLQNGKRLTAFQALHLTYALTLGIEQIHSHGEYHGDLHPENIMIERVGLSYNLKLIDFYHWDHHHTKTSNRQEDIVDIIKTFYQALGGARHYSKQVPQVKEICCGLKRGLILSKFRTVEKLRHHIEQLAWD